MPRTRSFVIHEELDKKMHRLVTEKKSYSEVMREALKIGTDIDQGLVATANRFAAALGISAGHVISNLALSRIAQLDADREVNGPTWNLLVEFQKVGEKMIEGEDAYRALKSFYVGEYEKRKQERESK